MPPDSDWSLVSDLFDAVVDLPPADRPAALDRLCADAAHPAALRAEVEALLAADALAGASDGVLSLTVAASAAALVDDGPVEGERVGPWRVVRPIGRGGMGRVDLVERADGGYQQRAALKRMSLVAPSRVRRFLRERQILARLEHPGIARLLDGGVADDGAPYLVMDYVEGIPITEYARTHDLGLRDKLALFVQVCDAVAYAHRHLVVHRDLKPSNVLVGDRAAPTDVPTDPAPTGTTRTASGPHVSLLDFGIARLLEDDLDDPLTVEGPGAPLTPGYAAPEQVAGEPVTTATDVYALGVLLYELLTGRRPHSADTRQAWAEAVLHRTPQPPSQTAPDGRAKPQKRLRGDLDAIALTALRREPDARYATAHDLAADLRHYLAGEPVQARRPSVGYRARRFVGRHRTATAAATLVALAVGIGATTTAWQAREARAAAADSEATTAFLTDLLSSADPLAAERRDTLRVGDLLDEGATKLADLDAQPRVQARIAHVLGSTYQSVERWDAAAPLLRQSLALYRRLGAPPATLAGVLADLGTVESAFGSPDKAESYAREGLDLAHTSGNPLAVLDAELGLAFVLLRQNMSAGADSLLFSARAHAADIHGEASLAEAAIDRHLGEMYVNRGDPASAEPYLRSAVAITEQAVGAEHPQMIAPLQTLSFALLFAGQADEAEAAATRAVEVARAQPGGNRLASALTTRAQARRQLGRLDQAEADLREAVPLFTRRNADRAMPLASLSRVLNEQGRLAEAIEAQTEAADLMAGGVTRERPATILAATKLADLLIQARRFPDANAALDRAEVLRAGLDSEYARMEPMLDGGIAKSRVALYRAWGRPTDAARWAERVPASAGTGQGGH